MCRYRQGLSEPKGHGANPHRVWPSALPTGNARIPVCRLLTVLWWEETRFWSAGDNVYFQEVLCGIHKFMKWGPRL